MDMQKPGYKSVNFPLKLWKEISRRAIELQCSRAEVVQILLDEAKECEKKK